MVWIWQHDKRAEDNQIILNCVRKLNKRGWERHRVKKVVLSPELAY
jgi:hypothetical protein